MTGVDCSISWSVALPSATGPVTLVWSYSVPADGVALEDASSSTRLDVDAIVSPLTARAPGLLPGDSLPPAWMLRGAPMDPDPPRVAVEATVRLGVPVSDPLTSSVPALTVVAPV